MVEIVADRAQEGRQALEGPATQACASNLGEPALDEIEPRAAGGREMQVHPRVSSKPTANGRTLVDARIVDDEMQIEAGRRFSIEPLEKGNELFRPVPRMTFPDHHAIEQAHGRKQRGRAVANVVAGFGVPARAVAAPRPDGCGPALGYCF